MATVESNRREGLGNDLCNLPTMNSESSSSGGARDSDGPATVQTVAASSEMLSLSLFLSLSRSLARSLGDAWSHREQTYARTRGAPRRAAPAPRARAGPARSIRRAVSMRARRPWNRPIPSESASVVAPGVGPGRPPAACRKARALPCPRTRLGCAAAAVPSSMRPSGSRRATGRPLRLGRAEAPGGAPSSGISPSAAFCSVPLLLIARI